MGAITEAAPLNAFQAREANGGERCTVLGLIEGEASFLAGVCVMGIKTGFEWSPGWQREGSRGESGSR